MRPSHRGAGVCCVPASPAPLPGRRSRHPFTPSHAATPRETETPQCGRAPSHSLTAALTRGRGQAERRAPHHGNARRAGGPRAEGPAPPGGGWQTGLTVHLESQRTKWRWPSPAQSLLGGALAVRRRGRAGTGATAGTTRTCSAPAGASLLGRRPAEQTPGDRPAVGLECGRARETGFPGHTDSCKAASPAGVQASAPRPPGSARAVPPTAESVGVAGDTARVAGKPFS